MINYVLIATTIAFLDKEGQVRLLFKRNNSQKILLTIMYGTVNSMLTTWDSITNTTGEQETKMKGVVSRVFSNSIITYCIPCVCIFTEYMF